MRRLLMARLVVFWVAVVVGATGLAGALGALGAALLPEEPVPIAVGLGVAACAVIARETVGRRRPVPQLRWQVPREWLANPWTGATVFGVIMGMGIFTLQRSALFHLYVLACLCSGGLRHGALLGLVYAIAYVAAYVWGMVQTRAGQPGRGVDWVASAWTRARWVGVVAAPLVVFLPFT